ncbi:hypothetical protein MD484_g566, partial [Candolleomyces efflorescens]
MALYKLSQAERDTLHRLAEKEQTLQAQINGLEGQLVNVRLQLAALRNKTSPAFLAPVEVLAMIFKLVHALGYEDGHACPRVPVEVAISGVCEKWRTIALSISSLWTVFRCLRPQQRNLLFEHERLLTYLERSGGRPIEISFEFHDMKMPSSGNSDDQRVDEMLKTALGQSHRWRRFVLASDGSIESFQTNLLSPLRTKAAPKLESLEIRTGKYHTDFNQLQVWNAVDWSNQIFSEPVPPLQYLRLDHSALLAGFQPHLNNLVHLLLESGPATDDEIPPLSLTAFVDILGLPSLETISVRGSVVEGGPLPASQIKADRLKHFRFGMSHSTNLLCLLVYRVVAPKLETLTVGYSWLGIFPSPAIADIELSDNSFPSLQSLNFLEVTLNSSNTPDHVFLRLIERTQKAKKLTISYNPHYQLQGGDLLSYMKQCSPNSTQYLFRICPEAEVITWRVPLLFSFPYELFRSDSWPNLSKLLLPPPSSDYTWPTAELLPARVKLEETGNIGVVSWPPDSKWASSDREDDAFIRQLEEVVDYASYV